MSIKIACCISGYPCPRVVEHLTYLAKYKQQMDFFIFFWDVVDVVCKRQINMLLQPKEIVYHVPLNFSFDARYKEPDKNDSKNSSISMFYGISQAQQLRKSYELRTGRHYDMVMRFRYDIHFISDFSYIIQNVQKLIDNSSIVCPWDRHHIGICDQFWIGKSLVMDKFIDMFSWIKNNINSLFFVNESVLYKFINANDIHIKCSDIRYVLRRSHLLGASNCRILSEYTEQITLPWVSPCPEKLEGRYQTYIYNKNESASNIYFITNHTYHEVDCKILNPSTNKYMYVTEHSSLLGINGSNMYTHFKIRACNAYLINIIINNPVLSRGDTLCLSVNKNKLIYTTDTSSVNSQFFLIKKGKYYCFAQSKTSDLFTNEILYGGIHIYMDKTSNIFTNGDKNMIEAEWNIIV